MPLLKAKTNSCSQNNVAFNASCIVMIQDNGATTGILTCNGRNTVVSDKYVDIVNRFEGLEVYVSDENILSVLGIKV